MKTNVLIIAAISTSIAFASCSNNGATTEETTTEETPVAAEPVNWVVDANSSNIVWTGGTAGATVYSHSGNLKVTKGALTTEGDAITAGNFVVDMTSIQPTDNGYTAENTPEKLVGHLASNDFFNIAEYPQATFDVTSIEGNTINGNLTIRGKSNAEKIEITNIEMMEDGTMKATGKLVFDRQKYDVAWVHFLKDTLLSDDIALEITLVAKQA